MPCKTDLIESPVDLPIYHQGPSFSLGKLPAFIYFALSGKDSLELDPFNQPAAFLQGFPIRVFSFTLPGHGPDKKNSAAIGEWAKDFSNGENPIYDFIQKAKKNIELLDQLNLIDCEKLAVGGLSRGGFIAAHLAAAEPRIQTLLGFAPMIALELSEEFQKYPIGENVLQQSLENLIPKLIGRSLRFYIGNRDILVHTDACYKFIRHLTEASHVSGIRSPEVELIITPSIGAKGHGTAPHIFLQGVNWLKEKLRII